MTLEKAVINIDRVTITGDAMIWTRDSTVSVGNRSVNLVKGHSVSF